MIGAVKGAIGHHVIKPVSVLEVLYMPIDQLREAP